jgi:hypothetical protein
MWWDRRAIDHRRVRIPTVPRCIRRRNDQCNDPQESVAATLDSEPREHSFNKSLWFELSIFCPKSEFGNDYIFKKIISLQKHRLSAKSNLEQLLEASERSANKDVTIISQSA